MGAGPMEEEFKKWCKGKDNVYFLGYTKHDNCLEIVRRSEFVVFPSIWYEGCSMVVIETESLGKAIVATDIGFMSEAVRDGVTGYKFRLKDVKDFRDKVQKLWNDEDKALEILTHHYVKNFGAGMQAEGLLKTIREQFPDADVQIIDYKVKKHLLHETIHYFG